MKNHFRSLFLFVILLFVGGCGLIPPHWEHPTNSKETIKIDHLSCLSDAWLNYPEKQGMVNEGWQYAQDASINCTTRGNQTTCYSSPAIPAQSYMIPGDENKSSRINMYGDCMTKKDNRYECIWGNGDVVSGSNCARRENRPEVEWVAIGRSDAQIFYFAPATIRKTDNIAKMWLLADRKTAELTTAGSIKSSKSRLVIDCKKEQFQIQATSMYSKNMGEGEVIGSIDINDSNEWRPTSSGPLRTMWKTACGER